MEKQYFEFAIRHDMLTENGFRKRVTEKYLVAACDFMEACKIVQREASMLDDAEILSGKLTKINNVYLSNKSEDKDFFLLKNELCFMDENLKVTKKHDYYIVEASSVDDAQENYKKAIKMWPVDCALISVKKTAYVELLTP